MQMQVQMHPPRRNQVQVQMQMPHLHLHLQMQVHLSTSLVKRDVRKAGEDEDWKKKTRDGGGWKRLSDEAVKKLLAAPHL